MARVKLDIPEDLPFVTQIPVRITDINYGGHLGNDAVLGIVHEARVRFLSSLGYTEQSVEGASIIMSDAHIVFRSEGFYGDTLTVRVGASNPAGVRFDIYYQLLNEESGKEIARVRTEISFYDYAARKTVPVPDTFIKRLASA